MEEEALIRKTADFLEVAEKVIDELRGRRPEDDIASAVSDFESPSLVEKVAIAQFVSQVAAAERLIAQDEEIRQRAPGIAQSALKRIQEQARERIAALRVSQPPLMAAPKAPSLEETEAGCVASQWPLVTVFRTEESLEVEVFAGEERVVFLCRTPQELSDALHKTADLLSKVLEKNP
jgi:hypothetical protein